MAKKRVKVLVIDRGEDTDIFLEDGGVASARHNGDNIVTDYYQSRINPTTDLDNIWGELAEGKMYCKDWPVEKLEVDEEVILDAIYWLYMSTDKIKFVIEKINTNDFTDDQIHKKLNSILKLEE